MKKETSYGLGLIAILLVVLILYFSFSFGKREEARLVATSQYGEVYRAEVEEYTKRIEKLTGNKMDIDKMTKEELKFIVKDILIQRKLLKEAKESPVVKTEDFKRKIEEAKKMVLRSEYLKYLAEKEVTEEKVLAKYAELKKELEGEMEYKTKHILVGTREEANQALQMLYTKSFEEVAKEVSTDVASARNGGDLGYILPKQLDSDFAEKLVNQPVGKVSNPFRSRFGWHIIQVEDVRDAVPAPYEQIKNSLKQQMMSQFINNYMSESLSDENLKIEFVNQEK